MRCNETRLPPERYTVGTSLRPLIIVTVITFLPEKAILGVLVRVAVGKRRVGSWADLGPPEAV